MPPERQRVFMVRRLGAVAVSILILILLVLGVRGCLNARKERAFENYASDMGTLAQQFDQLSDGFFGRFDDPKNLTELQFETEIRADRSTAEGLLSRAQDLDPPGELDDAQERIVLAFELRRDGLGAIADNIGGAFSDETDVRINAREQITEHMGDFLASDILYRRAQEDTDAVLEEEGINDQIADSTFLPDLTWLDESTVSEKLAGVTGAEGEVSGLHGLGVTSVLVNGTDVSPDSDNTVTAEESSEVEVSVTNQGDQEERDVPVSVSVTGGDEPIEADETLGKILPGETQTVAVPLEPAPPRDTPVTIEVFVEPVLGENVADDNEFSYAVTFE